MEAPGKVVGTFWKQPTRGSARVLPVHVVLWLQQVVGNREVQRFLTPDPEPVAAPQAPQAPVPEDPPVLKTTSSRAVFWFCAGAVIGAMAGAGMSMVFNLPIETGAAVTLAGLMVGLLTAWFTRKERGTP